MIGRFDDPEGLSRAAADLFVRLAGEAVVERGQFRVALSGGRTPRRTYRILAQRPWRQRTPWPHIHVFWGDERCVSAGDSRNNADMARRALLNHVPVPEAQVHPIQCDTRPKTGAEAYDALLRKHLPAEAPAFDLVFLGLGRNGHTASIFPDSPVFNENERWAVENWIEEEKMFRVTLTPEIINAARVVAFLVSGRGKAPILKDVLEGPTDPRRLPAQLIRPHGGRLIWLLDQAAASLLTASP
jgi:6-phosphogluconolactonase